MKILAILCAVLAMSVAKAEVYKYTNKQGKTSYSDVPVNNAEKIIVPPVMTYQAPVPPQATTSNNESANPNVNGEHVPYQSIEITQPQAEGTVRDNQGTVNVSYSLQPSLQQGDHVLLIVDGVQQQDLDIQGLDRGEHSLRLEVFGTSGVLQISSPDIRFYLHHQSRL
jgi:hypothetical protein